MNETKTLMERAEKTFSSAELLLREADYEGCVSRAYYAMFYAAEALLLTKNLKFSSHKGVISQFGEHFIKTEVFKAELGVATIKINRNGLWRDDHVSFDPFASRPTTLRDSSTKDDQTFFRHFFEEFEALLNPDYGLLNVFAGCVRLDVLGCSIFVSEHRNNLADLTALRHIQRNQFCTSSFLTGQRIQQSF